MRSIFSSVFCGRGSFEALGTFLGSGLDDFPFPLSFPLDAFGCCCCCSGCVDGKGEEGGNGGGKHEDDNDVFPCGFLPSELSLSLNKKKRLYVKRHKNRNVMKEIVCYS